MKVQHRPTKDPFLGLSGFQQPSWRDRSNRVHSRIGIRCRTLTTGIRRCSSEIGGRRMLDCRSRTWRRMQNRGFRRRFRMDCPIGRSWTHSSQNRGPQEQLGSRGQSSHCSRCSCLFLVSSLPGAGHHGFQQELSLPFSGRPRTGQRRRRR
jgi:hypothetical protein